MNTGRWTLLFARKTIAGSVLGVCAMVAGQGAAASAWHDGRMQVDVAGVVGRSDIVLERPNLSNNEALPMGVRALQRNTENVLIANMGKESGDQVQKQIRYFYVY